jgi:hypothetical protein
MRSGGAIEYVTGEGRQRGAMFNLAQPLFTYGTGPPAKAGSVNGSVNEGCNRHGAFQNSAAWRKTVARVRL